MRTGAAVLTAVLGVAAAATGLWLVGTRSAASGWTAYSPLSAETYPVFIGPPWWALALVVLGSALAGAAVAVLVLGRPRSARRHRPPRGSARIRDV